MDYLGEIIQNNEINNLSSDNSLPKVNICFKNFNGKQKIVSYNYGTPLNQALRKYLIQIGKLEIIKDTKKINFTYGAKKLSVNDETPIEEVFAPNTSVTVFTSF